MGMFFLSELIMIVITGFASTWKSLKIAASAGKSLNFDANVIIRTPKDKEQTQKDLQDKITHVVEELTKTNSSLSAPNEVLGKWEMCPWKSLKVLYFLFKKGYKHCDNHNNNYKGQ